MKRIAAVFLMAAACRAGPAPLRLGTTYTVQQSGALAVLESLWTGPAPLTTVVAPSGQILRAAANGDLDVVITHAPALEQRLLVGPGHALLRCPLAASRFAVVGPAADPARVATAATAVDAFRRIAAATAPFVSRGDSSGTHVKELALWRAAGSSMPPPAASRRGPRTPGARRCLRSGFRTARRPSCNCRATAKLRRNREGVPGERTQLEVQRRHVLNGRSVLRRLPRIRDA